MFGQLAGQPAIQDPQVRRSHDFLTCAFADSSIRPFAVRLWDGSEWHHGEEAPHFIIEFKHPGAIRRMFWRPTELSLGEAFIYDDFDLHGDLEACFDLADYLLDRSWKASEKLKLGRKLLPFPGRQSIAKANFVARLNGRAHSKKRDAEAIRYHYDVSNDFYRLWLDRQMVYSCAVFHRPEESLDEAQERKLDYSCRKLRLQPGEKLLDIGCGWGGLIIHAARNFGVEALGVTLSQAQAELAGQRVRDAGLVGQCRVEVCDYRDISSVDQFDKIVSVGMFEHVGKAKLPAYFDKAYALLRPGGVFLNHGITESMHGGPDPGESFIDKYVFPDGDLVPISTSLEIAESSGFEVRDVECLREHYAMTLRHWGRRLEANRAQAIALTSPVTYRIWRIYMAGAAYGFETNRLGVHQSLLVKSGRKASGLPLTRCDWYRSCPSAYH